jgi:hypothetical protein
METVASSKLQEDAAATIEALESNKEETRLEILMVGGWNEERGALERCPPET